MKNIICLACVLFVFVLPLALSAQEADSEPTAGEYYTGSSYQDFAEKTAIPSRSEKQNSATLNIGSEALVIGVEYARYVRLGGNWFPYMSISGGVGSWLEGNSIWGGVKTYYGEKNWAPYIGASAALWNGEVKDKSSDNLASIKALGIYIPLGIQYYGKNGFVISWEFAVYSIAAMNWNVKKDELEQPDTQFAFDSDSSWRKVKTWGALKIGFSF